MAGPPDGSVPMRNPPGSVPVQDPLGGPVPAPDPPDDPVPGTGPPDLEARAVAVFAALVDPTRRAVLNELARHGPATVSELARRLPVTRQAVAKHLEQLVEAGLVRVGRASGRARPYRLDPAPVRVALVWLSALATDWDDRLADLADHLDAARPRPPQPASPVRDG